MGWTIGTGVATLTYSALTKGRYRAAGQPKKIYQPKPQQGKMPITMKSSCDSLGQSMNPIVFHRTAMKGKYLGTIPKQNISYAMHFICISETHNLGQHFALNPDKICLSSLSWYLQNNISLSLSLRLIFRKGFTAHVAWIFGWMYSLRRMKVGGQGTLLRTCCYAVLSHSSPQPQPNPSLG